MTSRLTTILLLLAALPFSRCEDDDDDDDIDIDDNFEGGDDADIDLDNLEDDAVVSLTTSAFDAHIKDHKFTLVKFYAPWCGHCKKLEPIYKTVAKRLKEAHGIVLAKIDADAEDGIAKKYDVQGYPTLIWFEEGVSTKFDGEQTDSGIAGWCVSMIGEAVMEIDEFPVAAGLVPMIVLSGPKLNPAFEKAAKANRRSAEWHFMKSKGAAKVELQHIMDEPVIFEGDINNADELTSFAKDNAICSFGHLDSSSYGNYLGKDKGIIWTLFDGEDVESKHKAMMTEVGAAFKSKYWVSYTNIYMEENKNGINFLLGIKDFPAIAVHKQPGDKKRYAYFGEMTAAKIKQFISDVDTDKAQPYVKSEPVPKDNGSPVKQVVANTYEKEVFDKTKDTVVLVTAGDCANCKDFDPHFAKLTKMITNDYAAFFKLTTLNGTENESPLDDFEWGHRGYPLIYLVKAGEREHKLYEDMRNAKDVWEFLRTNATNVDEIAKISSKDEIAKKLHDDEL